MSISLKKTIAVAAAALCALALATGCASASSSNSANSNSAVNTPAAGANTSESSAAANEISAKKTALSSEVVAQFTQHEFTDAASGLSVTYNMFLPEGYSEVASYPMVVFISDSTSAGRGAEASLTQGLGGLVWASPEWQAEHPCIVCVPTYPETILDDHNGYTTTPYVELTKTLIDDVAANYAVDKNRIYGTGQSMGCMTTLILASEYPDLYSACMFVDGQWDVTTLKGLESQKFIYFAAEDDTSAFNGLTEVEKMFQADGVKHTLTQWDATLESSEQKSAVDAMAAQGADANFVTWKTGTVQASSGPGGGKGGSMGSVAYHMASFNYAYNCTPAMEWLFAN